MNSLLANLAIFYCIGILLAQIKLINFWLVILGGIVIYYLIGKVGLKNNMLAIAILFLVILWGFFNFKSSYILPRNHINNFVFYKDRSLYSLSGFVDSQPEFKDNHQIFVFRVQIAQLGKLRWGSCGRVLVKMNFTQELNYGDNLTLVGNLTRPYSFNSAAQGYKDYLKRADIYLIMGISDPRQIIKQPGFGGSGLISSSFWLRSKMENVISANLAKIPASILSAMVLGQKRGVPWRVSDSMVKSGTVHILVVSGFNVSIVAFILNLLLKILRFPRKIRIILIIICLLIYCTITGASNPVIRATVMGIVFLSAYLFKREPNIYNSLMLSAFFILIISPGQLFDIGFQLSFISVLAIVYLYPKLKALFCLEKCKNKIWRFMGEGFLVSLSAWLGTLWIIAFNFRIISPVTVLANIFIVPLATIITLCGFTLVISGLICPYLAGLFSLPATVLITLLLNINALVIKLPLAYIYF